MATQEPTTDVLVGAIGDPPPAPDSDSSGSRSRLLPNLLLGAGALLTCAAALSSGLYWSLRDARTLAGARISSHELGHLDAAAARAKLDAIIAADLARPMTLQIGDQAVAIKRSELGLRIDRQRALDELLALGHSGDPLVDLADWWSARRGGATIALHARLDRQAALDRLSDLKEDHDHAPKDAHLDLDHHTIAKEAPGVILDLYASLDRVETAARAGADRTELVVQRVAPKVTSDAIAKLDISTVLGRWETRYSSTGADSDRTFNLKVGASKLDGHVIQPHETFSFNQTVGDRTEKEGYRVAPVISAGELIDGLAGGMCQIATTLHAAAFFAAFDIVESRPHSRPSAYMTMGLDSTVVYPSVDLKLRNPYDFPVVMHYTVNQGAVRVELLGKARPYDVVFEREIKTETQFGHQTRRDPTTKAGQKLILQAGYPGYSLVRRRFVFDKGKAPTKLKPGETMAEATRRLGITPKQKNEWALGYPSTAEIVAIGSGSPKWKPKDPPPAHRIPPVQPTDKPLFRIAK